MSESYLTITKHFNTLLDFFRFGLSSARAEALYYGHGADNSWDDILLLILGSVSLPRDFDVALWNAQLTEEEKKKLAQNIYRRVKDRVPTPYITHEAYFCDLSFYVDERVLIPRSPIAELIEAQFSPWIDGDNVENILDLCTGSACIAIACCYAFPHAQVDAVDISKDALEVAEINKAQHTVADGLALIHSDCFERLPLKHYNIIVSNPPYVSNEEMKTLPNEYHHEPKLALEAKNNGLAIVDRILKKAAQYLSFDGILVMEVGNSEDALIEAYPELPFTWLHFERGGQGVFVLTAEQLRERFIK